MLPFKKPQQGDRCIIVASGPSAEGFKPPKGIPIIAVNGAIDWIDRASYFFTLDPSDINMRRLSRRRRRRGVQYCRAVAGHEALEKQDGVWLFNRVSSGKNAGLPEPEVKESPEWWAWRWGAHYGLRESTNEIANGNSAYGALNLAHHLGFKNVALVGVDGSREPRLHSGGTPNDLSHLPLLFASAREQINVVSCSEITSIPRMHLKEWIRTTNSQD